MLLCYLHDFSLFQLKCVTVSNLWFIFTMRLCDECNIIMYVFSVVCIVVLMLSIILKT